MQTHSTITQLLNSTESAPHAGPRTQSTLRLIIALCWVAGVAWMLLTSLFHTIEWLRVALVLVGFAGLAVAWRAMGRGELERVDFSGVTGRIRFDEFGDARKGCWIIKVTPREGGGFDSIHYRRLGES